MNASGPNWALFNAEWQASPLPARVGCDVLLTDPPYSDRVHAGRRTGSGAEGVMYSPLTPELAMLTAQRWAPVTRHWALLFCDHVAFHWHEAAWRSVGWYVFGPVYWVKPDPPPRMQGDGPTQSVEQIMVARPRVKLKKDNPRAGHRRGHYVCSSRIKGGALVAGQKPLPLLDEMLEDYALPGDVIADPYSGSGSTLVAAASRGLLSYGFEQDPATFGIAAQRLRSLATAQAA